MLTSQSQATASTPPLAATTEDSQQFGRVLGGQVRLLYRNAVLSQVVGMANACILALVQWPVITHAIILTWLSCVVLVALIRLALVRAFARARVEDAAIPLWRDLFLLGTAASGLLWGAAGIVLFPDQSLPHQMFVAFVVAGMVAGSVATVAALMPAFLLFAAPAVAPLMLQFLLRGGEVYFPMSVMTGIFALAMLTVARHVNGTLRASVDLSERYGDLVRVLSESNARAESLNRKLQAEIHERRQTERLLRESEASLSEAQRMAHLGSWTYDPRTHHAEWSKETFRIYGLDGAGAVPSCRALLTSLHPDDCRHVYALLERALTTGAAYQTEFRLLMADRRTRWVHAVGQPSLDGEGRVSFMRGTVLDVTERKRQELQLSAERQVLEAIVTGAELPQVLELVCQMIVRQLDCAGCSVLLLAPGGESLRFGAAAGLPEAYARGFDGLAIGPDGSCSGAAAYINDQVVVTDIATHPLWQPRREAALALGLRACCSTPIRGARRAVEGTLAIYLSRPRSPDADELDAIARAANLARIAIERHDAENQIRRLAHYDELTGLMNRAALSQELERAVQRAERSGRRLSLLFVDVDRFKNVNDTLGHGAGDSLLQAVANRLKACLRKGDLSARFGGDEFVLLLEDVPDAGYPGGVAGRILESLAAPLRIAEQEVPVTASIGIASYPEDGRDPQTLQKHADIAMYRAKDQGRNSYCFYAPQSNVHLLERLTLEANLRRALERGEFRLHYQPKQEIRSGRITGMEALLRWEHPDLGVVSPGQFIPMAEETGLIVPIGAWVLRTAAAQCAALRRLPGFSSLRMAVNLSARQFADDSLIPLVAGLLEQSGLSADGLELEITESLFMRNAERASRLLLQLKALGVQVAMDDFGTGYSSLAYLKRFPIDSIKIDRSFIQGLPHDGDDATITEAIIAMAHSLRLAIVAEGVENADQLAFLRSRGCEEIQGYFFSRPLPEDRLLGFLRRNLEASGRERAAPSEHIPVWP